MRSRYVMGEKLLDSLISMNFFSSSSFFFGRSYLKMNEQPFTKPYHFAIKLNYLHRNKPEGWSGSTRSIMKRKVFASYCWCVQSDAVWGGGRLFGSLFSRGEKNSQRAIETPHRAQATPEAIFLSPLPRKKTNIHKGPNNYSYNFYSHVTSSD